MANISNAVNMSFRVDKKLKKEADTLFKDLGLNTSVALNMFLNQCVREQGLPFVVTKKVSSGRLAEAYKEAEAIASGVIKAKTYKTFEEAIDDIDE